MDRVFDGADAVVHLAARPSVPRSLADPMASHLTNATGTMEVLEAARRGGRPHVVVASSSSVYGANPALPKREDMATMPVSPYAASKLAAESATLAYGHSFDLPVLAFRFFNVFGPLQDARPCLRRGGPHLRGLRAARGSAPGPRRRAPDPRLHLRGERGRRCWPRPSPARSPIPWPVNLAFGTRVSLLELIDVLGKVLGRDLERHHTEPRSGDVRDSQADQTRVRAMFPDVEPVGLEEGLRATVEWFRAVR